MNLITRSIILLNILCLAVVSSSSAAWVVREDERVFIEDRTGERWDVTKARQLGFVPHKFQYGIGKNAFTPLHDDDFTNDLPQESSQARIIGIALDGEAHAYSVQRLRRHEIANTTLAGKPITAGY